MFSRFDGFGSPLELAKHAKELGYTSFSTTNHGNTNGLVQTHDAALRAGLKPILGVEGYFIPSYKQQHRGYHLCLYAKNLKGYENLNRIQFEGEKQKYYNPIWTFDLLEEYSEGLICTSACVASFLAQSIRANNLDLARKYLQKSIDIFGDDFYIEIQPYKISEAGLQEQVNIKSMRLADEFKIPCILTSDSHYGSKEDWRTYLKMHEMDGHDLDFITSTYKQRYMPNPDDFEKRFARMHGKDVNNPVKVANKMLANIERLESSIEGDILGQLPLILPKISTEDGNKYDIVDMVKDGLKKRGKYNKQYISRCKDELAVIKSNSFTDYFIIVADYVNWAKSQGICVGAGRGSVCNSLVAYAMGITDVDSVEMKLDFRRFMREDKKVLPDIDLDFEMDRRGEVIEYIANKYPNKTARVSSYGLYKVDNTVNSLARVCGLPIDKEVEEHQAKMNKAVIAAIKTLVRRYKTEDGSIDVERLYNGPEKRIVAEYDRDYDGIILHFCKLYNKVCFIGTHAAGVVITAGDILRYTTLRIDKDGNIFSPFNLDDLSLINVVKFDVLGLKTMQSIGECRKLANINGFDVNLVNDPLILKAFGEGDTCGIFQFESNAAKKILTSIKCDRFSDVVATCSMNRPGPISMGIPSMYASNKLEGVTAQHELFEEYLGETYGTIVYQEQLMLICTEIGGLEWTEADYILKATKHGKADVAYLAFNKYKQDNGVDIPKKFIKNVIRKGVDEETTKALWDSMLLYSFNKGHATGYCIISVEEMFYKIYHPTFFWYTKLKYARDASEKFEYTNNAVRGGVVVFLPHVNYSASSTSIRRFEGEYVIQLGMADIKGVGVKAAEWIMTERKANGPFFSYDNFYDRCVGKGKPTNTKVLRLLQEEGAIEFDKKTYIKRVTAYNTASFSRSINT